MGGLGKVFCIITGASRGLGRSTAIAMAKEVDEGSVIVITARSTEALQETAAMVAEVNSKVKVNKVVADIGDISTFETTSKAILSDNDASEYNNAILIHNAASHMGMTKYKGSEINDAAAVSNFCNMHYTSMVCLTSNFLAAFKNTRCIVVNVSSLAASNPTKTRSLYCSMKAARTMFFRVLALEDPHVRVLSYDPGFMKTELLLKGIEDSKDHEYWTRKCEDMEKEGQFVSTEHCAETLVSMVVSDQYDTGAMVTVFDR